MSESQPNLGASGDALEETFRAAESAFACAAKRGATGERRMRLAGLSIRLRFAGSRLALIFDPAFGHLFAPDDGGRDDFVVTSIDGELSEAARVAKSPLFAKPAPGRQPLHSFFGDTALVLQDFPRGRSLQLIPDITVLPTWASASPLRTILGQLLASRGRYLMHGAAIGTAAGAVLLSAKGGSGKSTSALACLDAYPRTPGGAAPLLVGGDDFVVLESNEETPRAHSLFATAKVDRIQAALFPSLAGLIVRGGPLDHRTGKAVLRLFPGAAERLAQVLPLRAIVVPALALDEKASRTEPITRAEAMLSLAPSSLFLVPGAGKETLDALNSLSLQLPSYRLRIGSDVQGIPRAIRALLASLTQKPGEAS